MIHARIQFISFGVLELLCNLTVVYYCTILTKKGHNSGDISCLITIGQAGLFPEMNLRRKYIMTARAGGFMCKQEDLGILNIFQRSEY